MVGGSALPLAESTTRCLGASCRRGGRLPGGSTAEGTDPAMPRGAPSRSCPRNILRARHRPATIVSAPGGYPGRGRGRKRHQGLILPVLHRRGSTAGHGTTARRPEQPEQTTARVEDARLLEPVRAGPIHLARGRLSRRRLNRACSSTYRNPGSGSRSWPGDRSRRRSGTRPQASGSRNPVTRCRASQCSEICCSRSRSRRSRRRSRTPQGCNP